MEDSFASNAFYSLESEIELIGMLIQDNNRIEVIDHMLPEFFYLTIHGEIFSAIKQIINKKHPADVITISSHLHNSESFIEAGGKNYLIKMHQTIPFSTIKARGELIYALFLKRKLVNVGQEIIEDGNKTAFLDIKNAISTAESKIYSLLLENERGSILSFENLSQNIVQHFDLARKNDRPVTGKISGFHDLDNLLGGFKNSDLIIIGARPSMGKTALAVNIAYNIARQKMHEKSGGGVAFFALEMSAEQIAKRIVAIHSDQNSRVLDTGRYVAKEKKGLQVSDQDFNTIRDSILEIKNLPIFIDDSAAINISTLYSRARRLKRKYNIDMIMIDYLQLVRGLGGNSSQNRVLEVSEVTQGLKSIAKELNIPVIAMSQLSRVVESREDKKPQLSDLRESGAIEQDADIVMFLYRESYYVERAEPERVDPQQPAREPQETQEDFQGRLTRWATKKAKHDEWFKKYSEINNLAEVLVAKNRNGPIGNIELSFEKDKTKFYNRDKDKSNIDPSFKPKIIVSQKAIENIQQQASNFSDDFIQDDLEAPF